MEGPLATLSGGTEKGFKTLEIREVIGSAIRITYGGSSEFLVLGRRDGHVLDLKEVEPCVPPKED